MSVVPTSTESCAARSSIQPGTMTAVMRALPAATGPKVLRIGLVHGGRVIEDRIIKDRTSVTVGPSERAAFVVAAGATLVLFERVKGEYWLNVAPGMAGRIALEGGITDVAGLRGPVRLSDDSRGKVTLGDATFLFQFVALAPVPPRSQLPLSVKGGLASRLDWNLTIIAALSFLLHFGVIGALYSDWTDPIIATEATAGGVVDLLQRMPQLPLEMPLDTTAPSPQALPKNIVLTETPGVPAPHKTAAPKPMSAADVAALSREAAALGIATLGALQAHGTAVDEALRASDVPSVDLGDVAGSAVGARPSTGSALHLNPRGDIVRPGSTNLGSLGDGTGGSNEHAAKEIPRGGPTGDVVCGLSDPIARVIPGAEHVVAGLHAGFRACYNAGLNLNPAMSGRVTLTARIATNGEVASTESSDNTGLSDGVVQCLQRRLRTAQFEPGASPVTLKIPAAFLPQQR
jgi:hypothetical protein